MTDPNTWLALPAGGALVAAGGLVRHVWRNRRKYEQVVEVLAGEDLKVTETTRTNNPGDLVSNPSAVETVVAQFQSQVTALELAWEGRLTTQAGHIAEIRSQFEDFRTETREELGDKNRRIADLEAELARVRTENERLHGENQQLLARQAQLEDEINRLRGNR